MVTESTNEHIQNSAEKRRSIMKQTKANYKMDTFVCPPEPLKRPSGMRLQDSCYIHATLYRLLEQTGNRNS
jgi:hypothetical protein